MWVSERHPDRERLLSRPAPPEESGERLATIPRGIGEELRVTLAEFKGHPYVSLRVWTQDGNGGWWPRAGKGLSIRIRELDDVVEALRLASDQAEAGA